jgi:tRNA pseudouridine65 synthase
MSPPLHIIYQDDALVAVYKPEGMLVHRSNIDKHETVFLLQRLRDQIGQHLYPIQRLDKPSSGLILFALAPEIAAQLQAQMETNACSKEYLLVCRGHCPEAGVIDHPLKHLDDFKNKHAKAKPPKPAQSAITEYRRLATITLPTAVDKYPSSRYSLVLANILTGRKHQIRRHFKHLSHPLIGCPKYGKSSHNRYFAEQLHTPRLLLHAYRMQLQHPVSGEQLVLVAEPEGVMRELLLKFGWDYE